MFSGLPPYDPVMSNLRLFLLGVVAMVLWAAPFVIRGAAYRAGGTPQTLTAPMHGSAVQRVDVHGPAVQGFDIYQQPGPHGAAVVWITERPS